MSEATFRDFKAFTRERIQELIFESEQNLSESLRLMETLVDDAKEMASADTQMKVSERYNKMVEVFEQVTDLLDNVRV